MNQPSQLSRHTSATRNVKQLSQSHESSQKSLKSSLKKNGSLRTIGMKVQHSLPQKAINVPEDRNWHGPGASLGILEANIMDLFLEARANGLPEVIIMQLFVVISDYKSQTDQSDFDQPSVHRWRGTTWRCGINGVQQAQNEFFDYLRMQFVIRGMMLIWHMLTNFNANEHARKRGNHPC